MIKKITLNHLLKYHYNELSCADRSAVEEMILTNEEFRLESARIIQMKKMLDGEIKKPSSSSIRIIMDYNRNRKSQGELEVC
jgi:hypothetical protein